MKISLDEINNAGLQFSFEEEHDVLSDALLTIALPTGTSISPFLTGDIALEDSAGLILVHGQLTARVTQQCARCLTTFDSDWPIDLRLVVRKLSSEQISRDVALLETHPEEIAVSGNELDLGELIIQEILLDLPIQPLCRDDCPGLCPRCGEIKGSVECRCEEEKTIDPRWQKLIRVREKQ